jgi:hypothetical protein
MWSSSEDDSDSDEFSGEEDNGYVHYLLHPSPFLDEDEDDEVEQNPIQPGFTRSLLPIFSINGAVTLKSGVHPIHQGRPLGVLHPIHQGRPLDAPHPSLFPTLYPL